ncbi:MAG TPA: carboxypeptidase-like regulatory domain-containing protein [Bryobacteraceae bacterium]|jgi:hypothetical protein
MRHHALLLLSLLIAAPVSMFGQTAAGTLTGIVTDPSGAVLAGLPVTATNAESGTKILGTTSQTGNYTLPQMPVGRYVITVSQTGFKTFRQENVIIAAAQTLRLDIPMEVGANTESVTVTSESTLLQADSAAIVHNVISDQIQNLPVLPATIFIRDPLQTVMTLPGSVYSGLPGIVDRMNGLPTNTYEYKVDGEPVTNTQAPTITTRENISPDALQEVAVQTSSFNAEYGAVSGTLFNMVLKSGTNQFHGSMYDYLANDDFNARDAVTHLRNQVRRNDYGFTIGGPVWLPKIYNGKNKTFFFFNWEQYRDYSTQTNSTFATVPTAAYRGGDFSSLIGLAGNTGNLHIGSATTGHDYRDPLGNTIALGTIFDPNSTHTVTCNGAVSQDCTGGQVFNNYRTPLPGNKLPATYIDPVAAKILSKYVPLPNGPNAALLTNNYLNPVRATRFTDSPAIKIDENVGTKARVAFSYAQNKTTSPIQTLGGLAEGFPEPITANAGTFETAPTYRANFDYTIEPTLLFHFGAGWMEYNFCACPLTTDYNAASDIGLVGATAPKTSFPPMASTVVSSPILGGLKNIGSAGPGRTLDRHPSSSANLTWVHGNHTAKFGAEWRIDTTVFPSLTNTGGFYQSFGGASASATSGNGITSQPALSTASGFTGNTDEGFPFANWLMGSVTSFTLSNPVEYSKSKQQYGIFLQDTWRIRRNLTLDYGVRWDYGTYAKEQYGRVADLSLTTPNPAAAGRPGAYIYEASCNCHFAQNYPFAIGPRVGIAYTLDKKTVIRGGAAIAYDATPFTGGGVINSSQSPTAQNGFDLFKFSQGVPSSLFPAGVQTSNPAAGFTVGAANAALAGLVDPNAGRPDRTYQWNISVQRELTRNTVVEVAYVGNRNIWQPTGGFQDFNAISPAMLQRLGFTINNSPQGIADEQLLNTRLNSLSAAQSATLAARGIGLPYAGFGSTVPQTVLQSLKNYPQFSGGIAPSAPLGKSWYDALQATLTKRYSHGLSLTAAYTFSKNLQWYGSPDIFNHSLGKDLVGANPPQTLHIAFEYRVPRYKGNMPVMRNKIVSYALADWALSSALYYQSGAYLGRPLNGATNPISLWLGRGPGGAQLLKNADGSYMNPWSVNWTDLSGNHHTDPLNINCHCFDPAKTVVLNPAVWGAVPDASFAADTSTLPFFRGPRHPMEAMNFARNFVIKERFTFQVRMELQNVFNRVQLPGPATGFSPTNVAASYQSAPNGNYINGFGTFGNSTVAGYLGTPRSGQLVARFSF